jgi:predicted transcriptional regulator with HTH domain
MRFDLTSGATEAKPMSGALEQYKENITGDLSFIRRGLFEPPDKNGYTYIKATAFLSMIVIKG